MTSTEWRRLNPKRAEAQIKKDYNKQKLKKRLKVPPTQLRFVASCLSKGQSPVDVAMGLRIPMSIVLKVQQELRQQDKI